MTTRPTALRPSGPQMPRCPLNRTITFTIFSKIFNVILLANSCSAKGPLWRAVKAPRIVPSAILACRSHYRRWRLTGVSERRQPPIHSCEHYIFAIDYHVCSIHLPRCAYYYRFTSGGKNPVAVMNLSEGQNRWKPPSKCPIETRRGRQPCSKRNVIPLLRPLFPHRPLLKCVDNFLSTS